MTTTTDTTAVVDVTQYIDDSSFVEFLAYDEENQLAYVQLDNGTYVYSEVPREDYDALEAAESTGHAFHHFARKHGPYMDFHKTGELFYEYRKEQEDKTGPENVFSLVPGEGSEEPPEIPDFLSGLIPSDEEIQASARARNRHLALSVAGVLFQGKGPETWSGDLIAVAQNFENYLNGE